MGIYITYILQSATKVPQRNSIGNFAEDLSASALSLFGKVATLINCL